MKRDCCAPAIGVPELSVGSPLTDLLKTEFAQYGSDLFGFEDRDVSHLRHHHGLCSHKFGFQPGIPVFQQHFDDLF